MFKVVSVRGNSVRIRTGLVSFDVLVIDNDGRGIIQKPKGIYVHDRDMSGLVKMVLEAFYNEKKGFNENDTQTKNQS